MVQGPPTVETRRLGLPEVGAFAKPENRASVRVLEKAGFSRVEYVAELERDRFRVTPLEGRRRHS